MNNIYYGIIISIVFLLIFSIGWLSLIDLNDRIELEEAMVEYCDDIGKYYYTVSVGNVANHCTNDKVIVTKEELQEKGYLRKYLTRD